jgi:hypothetical protein
MHLLLPAPELKTLSHSMNQFDKSLQWTPCRKHQAPADVSWMLWIADNLLQSIHSKPIKRIRYMFPQAAFPQMTTDYYTPLISKVNLMRQVIGASSRRGAEGAHVADATLKWTAGVATTGTSLGMLVMHVGIGAAANIGSDVMTWRWWRGWVGWEFTAR